MLRPDYRFDGAIERSADYKHRAADRACSYLQMFVIPENKCLAIRILAAELSDCAPVGVLQRWSQNSHIANSSRRMPTTRYLVTASDVCNVPFRVL